MEILLARIKEIVPTTMRRVLGVRFDKSPIQTVEKLIEFVHTRSAYIAQTSLYGYLKTRMGTRFRQVFEDDKFLPSINSAKWQTYGACLSDLSIFVAAESGREAQLDATEIAKLASYCFNSAVEITFDDAAAAALRGPIAARFAARVKTVQWANAAISETAFTDSPEVLLSSAPIADELKVDDGEIVKNSIRFRWRDVREQLRKRLDAQAVCLDWREIENRKPPPVNKDT